MDSQNGFSKKVLQMSSPNELSKWALQIETWLEYPGSLLGGCWEDSGSPLLIILEFGGLFNHKFCKFLCLVRYERNLWKMNTYLVSKIKKVKHFITSAGWSNGYDTCLSPKSSGFNSLCRWGFFKTFFYTFLYISLNLVPNSWLINA